MDFTDKHGWGGLYPRLSVKSVVKKLGPKV